MEKVKSKAVRVKLKDTEKIRKKLIEKDILEKNLKIFRKNGFSYLPIKKEIDIDLETTTEYFKRNKERINSYQDYIPIEEIKDDLPTSFDIIGDTAVIKLDKDIKKYKKEIGNAILKTHKNIKTVCMTDPVSGEYRTRNLEIIAGENKTKTIHKEFNLSFLVDLKKVYFSPRLANERKRIADIVKNNEIIVDMFTGVAPFPILISKYSDPKMIYAIDKNKDAIELAKINVRKNKAYDKIKLICADSKNVKKLLDKYNPIINIDRIIMNLPFSSFDFFDCALRLIKNKTVIHYYEIISEERIDKRIEKLKELALNKNISLTDFRINKIKSYSPREFYIGIDITAKKETPM